MLDRVRIVPSETALVADEHVRRTSSSSAEGRDVTVLGPTRSLLGLQRSAGNAAVVELLARTVQRDPPPTPAPAPTASVPAPPPPSPDTLPPRMLADQQLGPQLADAGSKGDTARETALEDEFERRADAEEQQRRGIGVGIPPGAGAAPQGAAGTTAVSPEVALQMLENVSKGEPAFKPALGKGGASWFVTEGAPYTSVDAAKNVLLEVTIDKAGQSSLSTAQLDAMFEVELLKRADIEAAWRARFNHQGATPTSGKLLKSLKQFAKRFAESKMWDRVGEMANAAPAKVLEVSLEDSQFSKSANGKFTVVADGSKIKVKGGVGKLLSVVEGAGLKAEPAVSEAAVLLAQRMAWAGRVRTVLRVGGRVAIIVAVAADVVKIYYAQDRVKATVESLGGWAGATAGAAAFAAWWTPADVAGPWAWVGHGVGTLVSGAVGYWIGESTTRWVYELVAE